MKKRLAMRKIFPLEVHNPWNKASWASLLRSPSWPLWAPSHLWAGKAWCSSCPWHRVPSARRCYYSDIQATPCWVFCCWAAHSRQWGSSPWRSAACCLRHCAGHTTEQSREREKGWRRWVEVWAQPIKRGVSNVNIETVDACSKIHNTWEKVNI